MKILVMDFANSDFVAADSKDVIVNALFTFRLAEDRTLFAKMKGYDEESHHSYGSDYTDAEAIKDAVNFLFDRLTRYNWNIYVPYKG